MKCLIPMVVCSSVLFAANAIAGEWNIGANYGVATGDTGTSDLNKDLAAQGLNATADSSDDTRTAWTLYMGYDFLPNWGVEGGYVDLGEVTTSFSGTATDIDTFLAASSDIHPNTAQGWQLSGVYYYPFEALPQLKAKARVGAFFWESDYTLHGVTAFRNVDESGTDISFGLGLKWMLDQFDWTPPGLSANVNWDRYSIDGEPIDLFSVGLAYRFR